MEFLRQTGAPDSGNDVTVQKFAGAIGCGQWPALQRGRPLAPTLPQPWCMSLVRKTIPVVILMICFAGRARCETLTALSPNQQAVRNWTVSAALQTFVLDGPVPLLGVEVAYHPIDRLAVAARLTTVLIAFDLAADVRYFVVPVQPRSGLYASIGGHLLAAFFGSGKGGSVELGYEKQLPGGVNVAASAGVTLLGLDSCGCGRPEQGTNWTWVPTVNLRMGRSF